MLVINPEECIDCGVCEPECPVEAILPDTEERAVAWVEFNQKYADQWPVITERKDPPADADSWQNVEGRLDQHFSPNSG